MATAAARVVTAPEEVGSADVPALADGLPLAIARRGPVVPEALAVLADPVGLAQVDGPAVQAAQADPVSSGIPLPAPPRVNAVPVATTVARLNPNPWFRWISNSVRSPRESFPLAAKSS